MRTSYLFTKSLQFFFRLRECQNFSTSVQVPHSLVFAQILCSCKLKLARSDRRYIFWNVEYKIAPSVMKYVYQNEILFPAGELIKESRGTIVGPLGEILRQVITEEVCYASSTWISSDGACYQRFKTPYHDWELSLKKYGVDATGSLTVQVGGAGKFKVIKLCRAIALAWIEAPRVPYKLNTFVEGDEVTADTVFWVKQGKRPTKSGEKRIRAGAKLSYPLDDDEWTPLKYTWNFFNGDSLHKFDAHLYGNHSISRRGWVRFPDLTVSKGHRSPCGRMWVAIQDVCCIWIDRAVLESFEHTPSRRCTCKHLNGDPGDSELDNLAWEYAPVQLSKSISDITDLFMEKGFNAQDAGTVLSISRQAVWSRLHQAVQLLPLHVIEFYLQKCVARVVHSHFEQNPQEAFLPMASIDVEEIFRGSPFELLEPEDKYGMCLLSRELFNRKVWQNLC